MTELSRPGMLRLPLRCVLLGGARSGKSALAEQLATVHQRTGIGVTYLATGYPPSQDDADWSARILSHTARRNPAWATIETTDVVDILANHPSLVLWDDTGTWTARLFDAEDSWANPLPNSWWTQHCQTVRRALAAATAPRIIVGPETGMSPTPEHQSARRFQDATGELHQHLVAVADEAYLAVAGRALPLTQPEWATL